MKTTVRPLFGWICPLALLLLAGCERGTPEERLAEVRSRYRAQLNGFIVRQIPVPEPAAEGAAAEGATPESAAGEGAEEPAAAPESAPAPPTTRTVLLDILVQHDAMEKLPGVTLDITLAADRGEGAQKGRWLLWVDTASLPKATAKQLSHELVDVPYEEGDGFHVEVRHPVPPDERGDYREFHDLGAGG